MASIGLTAEQLGAVFPFHLAFDRNDTLVQVGDGLRKALPGLAPGRRVDQHFRARRPKVPLTYGAVREQGEALFLLESTTSPLVLKGQMLAVDGVIVFLGSPWVTAIDQLASLGLSLQDFALHDPVADYLVLLQTQKAALDDVETLSTRLAATKQRLASILASMDDSLLVLDSDGRIQSINDATCRLLGYAESELLGRHVSFVFADGGGEEWLRGGRLRELVHEQAVRNLPATYLTRSGDRIPVLLSGSALRDMEGALTGVVCVARDARESLRAAADAARAEAEARRVLELSRAYEELSVTLAERKRAEEELRRSQFFLTQSQEAARIGCWEWDIRGQRLTCTDEFYRLLGLRPEGVPISYQRFLALCHPEDRDRVRATLERACTDDQPYQISFRIVRPDGQTRTLHVRGAVLRDASGPARMLGTGQDVTEFTQLKEKLALSQRLEAVGRLAGGVAHDFNNLLTAIMSYGDLVLEGLAPTDPHRADVMEIRRAAERAAGLTQQLLAFSRRQTLQPKVLDLNSVVRNLEGMLRRLIGEDVEVVAILQPQLGRVLADPGQLEQVIMNLAVNARDAMPGGGRLVFETADVEVDEFFPEGHGQMRPGRYVMLAVSDSGTGMDEETKAHVFEPFFTTKPVGKGTGLGLATVYGIVKQSGGYIWVYSELGRGTTFKIYLPRVSRGVEPLPAPSSPEPAAGGQETLLLVEDEEAVRKVVRAALEKRGYTVLEASNGGEALQRAEAWPGPIDLVVTDVVMPEMGGRELVERLGGRRPQARVLFVSGYTEDALVRQDAGPPGLAYLQKPFTAESLARKVRELLDQPLGATLGSADRFPAP